MREGQVEAEEERLFVVRFEHVIVLSHEVVVRVHERVEVASEAGNADDVKRNTCAPDTHLDFFGRGCGLRQHVGQLHGLLPVDWIQVTDDFDLERWEEI